MMKNVGKWNTECELQISANHTVFSKQLEAWQRAPLPQHPPTHAYHPAQVKFVTREWRETLNLGSFCKGWTHERMQVLLCVLPLLTVSAFSVLQSRAWVAWRVSICTSCRRFRFRIQAVSLSSGNSVKFLAFEISTMKQRCCQIENYCSVNSPPFVYNEVPFSFLVLFRGIIMTRQQKQNA